MRWHWNSALAGALISAILLGGMSFLWRMPKPSPIAIHAPPAPVTPTVAPTATPAPLVIFISGAVQTPGVYPLPSGSRVVDALERAGGFTPDANVNAINQAAPLRDGDQIYVPTLAEEPAAPPSGLSNTEPAAGSGGGPINVNSASLAELEQLPGIGPSRAQDIIDNRPYESVDDLDRVPGIGPATLEELRPYVVVE
jgi:competence protein ComEA